MSVKEELELDLDISAMCCLRSTLDTRNKQSMKYIYSSEFRFQGGGWKLIYYYDPGDVGRYDLYLQRCSGVSPDPFHVSVRVESSGTGRIVSVLSEETRFSNEFQQLQCHLIWRKLEDEILRAVPEFCLYGVLKLVVVLKLGDIDSKASQTEWTVPETAGQSNSTILTSVPTALLPNTTPCFESLSKDLAQLMVEGSDHDVEFQCGGQSTKAHKLIVCQRSSVIAAMLAIDMVEGRTGVVKIPDMEPDTFARFLRYVYSGQLEELTFEVALRLFEAGDQYAVHGLANRCAEFLLEHLTVDNAYEALVVADAHSNKDFVEKVVDYMVDHRIPLVSEAWSAFCAEHPNLANKVLNRTLKACVK